MSGVGISPVRGSAVSSFAAPFVFLCGDIGGTNARLSLYQANKKERRELKGEQVDRGEGVEEGKAQRQRQSGRLPPDTETRVT